MTDTLDPSLKDAIANVSTAETVLEQEHRSQKLQEVSNLVIKAAATLASELKVFLPLDSGFAFDLANLTWTGTVGLMHSTIPTIFFKPVFTAKYEGSDTVALSANDGEHDEHLFTLPAAEVNQATVTEAVKKFFEPKLTAVLNAHDPQATSV